MLLALEGVGHNYFGMADLPVQSFELFGCYRTIRCLAAYSFDTFRQTPTWGAGYHSHQPTIVTMLKRIKPTT